MPNNLREAKNNLRLATAVMVDKNADLAPKIDHAMSRMSSSHIKSFEDALKMAHQIGYQEAETVAAEKAAGASI